MPNQAEPRASPAPSVNKPDPGDARARWKRLEDVVLPETIGALFDRAVEREPDAVLWDSIDDQGPTLSYAAFAAEVARTGHGLRALGVGRGVHVGLMLPNIPAMLIHLIALAKLGAVAVPINVTFTPRELGFVSTHSDLDWLVIEASLLPVFDRATERGRLTDERLIVVGDGASNERPARRLRTWDTVRAGQPAALASSPQIRADDLCTILFTSGSTGLPKGCMLSHRYWAIIGHVRAHHAPEPVRRILIDLPFCYMSPIWRLMMALSLNARLCVARRYSLSRLIDRLRRHHIEFASVNDPVASLPDDDVRGTALKWLCCSGLSRHVHGKLEARFGVPIREIYALTETGAVLGMPVEDPTGVGSGSCGVPAPYRELRIVGPDGRDVADGAEGELWVRGPGMLLGYYNNPEATAAAMTDGWFRTGDLFHRDERGYYTIVGRIKDMIRRSGENIAAGEVEAVLAGLDGVEQCAVVAVPDSFRKEEVKAYVCLRAGLTPADVPPERIFAHCAAELAPFKVPRYVEYVAAFPKTASNKVSKPNLIGGRRDLRAGSFDRVEGRWHPAEGPPPRKPTGRNNDDDIADH